MKSMFRLYFPLISISVIFAILGNSCTDNSNGPNSSLDEWVRMGTGLPEGSSIDVLIHHRSRIIATSGSLKLFASDNYGESWHGIGEGFPSGTSIVEIAVVDSLLMAATRGEGIQISSDNGETWFAANSGIPQYSWGYAWCWAITSTDSRIFVGTDKGLYVSDNMAVSWQEVTANLPLNMHIRGIEARESLIAVIAIEGVFFSDDNGDTWYTAMDGLPTFTTTLPDTTIVDLAMGVDFVAATDTAIFIGGEGLYRLYDGSNEWIQMTVSAQLPFAAMALSGSIIFIGTGSGVLYSTDMGSSWQPYIGTWEETDYWTGYTTSLVTTTDYIFAGGALGAVWRANLPDDR